MIQPMSKLQPAARHIGQRRPAQFQRRVIGQQLPRLVDATLPPKHRARNDQRLRLGPVLSKPKLDRQLIRSDFRHSRPIHCLSRHLLTSRRSTMTVVSNARHGACALCQRPQPHPSLPSFNPIALHLSPVHATVGVRTWPECSSRAGGLPGSHGPGHDHDRERLRKG